MRKLIFILLLFLSVTTMAQQYDVLIRNGRIADGSGNPWFAGDVGIMGDRITFIGRAPQSATAKCVIDARGLVVAPGFIDMLGQSEEYVLIDRRAVSKITQGITSEITGEGGSIAPVNERTLAEEREFLERYKLTVDWRDLEGYFRRFERERPAINLGTYVGATQVRRYVLGDADRAATPDELRQMEKLVDEAMRQGAMGLSTSLIYAPAFYASTDELIALARVAARHGGIYASHIRNEGNTEAQALEETFRIGREAGLPVEIWHLKASGRQNWGNMKKVVAAIEQARASGVDVTADQYPYPASSTSLGAVIPPKYHEGGSAAFVARLKDPQQRAAIRRELENPNPAFENMWTGVGGPAGVLVVSVLDPALHQFEGKTIAQIAQEQKKDPLDALMDLVVAGRDNVGAVYFTMSEDDLRLAMQQPWVSVGCDSGGVAPDGVLGQSKTHPRAYGSFTRILGKYVRQEKLFPLEWAIRKFTSLPAQRVGLKDRGLLKPGFYADITIFNPETVNDRATFDDPHQPSVGIEYVLVNGVLTLERGKFTGEFGGRPLRGPGYRGK